MINFNGIHSDTFADIVSIMNVRRPAFPGARSRTLTITGRDGAVYYGRDTEPATAGWRVVLKSDSLSDRRQAIRGITKWLVTKNAGILKFDDELDKQYYAVLISPIDPDEAALLGFLDIEMFIPDGCAYAVDTKTEQATGELIFQNDGQECPFILEAALGSDVEELIIELTENEYIEIDESFSAGDTVEIDTSKRTVKRNDTDKRGKVTFDSQFFKLPAGGGQITADPSDTELELTWRERYF